MTLRYVAPEDRVVLRGSMDDERLVTLWLTRRTLDEVIPKLLCVLLGDTSSSPSGAVREQTSQRLARQTQAANPAPPVIKSGTETPGDDEWLVRQIRARTTKRALYLTFCGDIDERRAQVRFSPGLLRQWFNVLVDLYQVAGWSTAVWPSWMLGDAATGGEVDVIRLH